MKLLLYDDLKRVVDGESLLLHVGIPCFWALDSALVPTGCRPKLDGFFACYAKFQAGVRVDFADFCLEPIGKDEDRKSVV